LGNGASPNAQMSLPRWFRPKRKLETSNRWSRIGDDAANAETGKTLKEVRQSHT
jgi:hypothetical protein